MSLDFRCPAQLAYQVRSTSLIRLFIEIIFESRFDHVTDKDPKADTFYIVLGLVGRTSAFVARTDTTKYTSTDDDWNMPRFLSLLSRSYSSGR